MFREDLEFVKIQSTVDNSVQDVEEQGEEVREERHLPIFGQGLQMDKVCGEKPEDNVERSGGGMFT